jgi:hypothetical protein
MRLKTGSAEGRYSEKEKLPNKWYPISIHGKEIDVGERLPTSQ